MNYNISNTILIVILLIFFTFIIYFIYDNYIQYMFVQEGLSSNEYAAIKDMNNSKYTTNYAFELEPHDHNQNIKFKQVNTGDRTEKIILLGEDSNVYTINSPLSTNTTDSDKNSLQKNTNKKMNYVTMSEDGKTFWGIDTTNDAEGGKAFKYDTTKVGQPIPGKKDWEAEKQKIKNHFDYQRLHVHKHNGAYYRGTLNKTTQGYTCQNWTSQSPHRHARTDRNFPNRGIGNHNYCRNPDGEHRIWCYTTNPGYRYDFCTNQQAYPLFDKSEAITKERLDSEKADYERRVADEGWLQTGSDERFQSLDVGRVQVIGVNNSGHMFTNEDVHNYKQWSFGKTSYKRLISKNARTSHNNYYYLWRNGRLGEDKDNKPLEIGDTREMSEINFSIAQAKLVGVDKQGNACIWEGNKWKEILFPGSMTFKSIAYYAPHEMIFAIGTDGKLYLANKKTREEYKSEVDNRNKQIEEDARKAKEEADRKAEEERKAKAKAEEERKAAEEAAAAAAAEDARKAKEDAERKAAAEREAKRLAEEARQAAAAAAAKAKAERDTIKKGILELEAKVAKGEKERADREAEKAKGEKEAAEANAKAKQEEKNAIIKQFNAIDKKIDIVDKTKKEDNKTIYSRMLGNDYKVYNALKHNLALAKDGAIKKGSYDAQEKVSDSNRKYRSAQEEKERKQEEERIRQLEENRGNLISERVLVQATDVPLIQSFDYNTTTN